ncbi:aminotransferase class I/II-fold pyridoxal phosphate-dependent enzyme [Actinomadura bangladeshensis]|uniref:8-amino-7-oxononanoate synthase n=1 Tax=Actinomadura bangladeshensis TaxID=453573 RepID=A0A4R4N9T0_9ACTN|nr:aminotransferase class I/II-fold pyridoxal phosphate-dependent enzyme [Actinomadura bangladeshensis]TDC05609.1 aminotransferase class I/II-fold pyridoxal phosphate-dependent enzyme [Actinomadura bangladeshensis]
MTDLAQSALAAAPARRQVLEIIASNTLYDVAQLRPESHFEGELGVDAAVLEAILGDVRDRFGPHVRLPGEPATPQDLIDAVERAAADRPARNGAEPPEAVMTAAMRHTHYRRDQLDLDAELEAELGIDSVVLASIIGDAAEELGLPDGLASEITVPNLRALIEELRARAGGSGAPGPEPGGGPGPEPGGGLEQGGGPGPEPGEPAIGELDPVRPAPSTSWDGRSMRDFMDDRAPDLFAKARGFTSYLRGREAEHLYWYGMPLRSRCANRARIHDELTGRTREFLMFASNNYLGLANHPRVIDAICEATRSYGATNTGCRIIGGTNHLHKELERRLAAFKRRPACIVYPGGYSANLGSVSALVKSHDALIVDKLNHMSIVDGCKLSGGVRKIYGHNDMRALERVLERCEDQVRGGKLIVTDGVFSMHGDVCDLPEIVRLARRYGARVMVDDAHATGVLGDRGSGTAEHFGLKDEVDLELGTMSKALAGMGGFVVGDEEVVEYLRFYSNSYVFAATIPAGVAAGLIAAIDVLEEEPERLAALWANIRRLRADLTGAGFDLEHSQSAILPIVIGDERRAMEMGRAVRARGLFCQTVVFPGVPLGDARLRVSVTSEHTAEDLALAAQIFVDAARETGVLPGRGGREAGR